MTREEMATRLERVCGVTWQDEADIAAAASELRKTCAGCKHFLYGDLPINAQPLGATETKPAAVCLQWMQSIPADGGPAGLSLDRNFLTPGFRNAKVRLAIPD